MIIQDAIAELRQRLLMLARLEDESAAREAADVPYWSPLPLSVLGHREAARILRHDADELLVRSA